MSLCRALTAEQGQLAASASDWGVVPFQAARGLLLTLLRSPEVVGSLLRSHWPREPRPPAAVIGTWAAACGRLAPGRAFREGGCLYPLLIVRAVRALLEGVPLAGLCTSQELSKL